MHEFFQMKPLSMQASIVVLVLAACMLFLSRTRQTYPGFHIWTTASICSCAGLAMISLRGLIPDFFSVLFSNGFLLASVWLLSTGLIRFAQLPYDDTPHILAILVCMLCAAYYTYVHPSLGHRIILFSAFLALGVIRFVWLLEVADAPYMHGSRTLILFSCILGIGWAIFRIAAIALYHMDAQDLLSTSFINGMTLVVNSCCYIGIFFGLCAFNFQRVEYDLTKARDEVKALKGIIPICCSCKKIRDDKGYWNQVEAYIRSHTDAEFSHGFCPDCYAKALAGNPGLSEIPPASPSQPKG